MARFPRALLVFFLGLSAAAATAATPEWGPGWHRDVVFTEYSPLAAKWEFARRVFAPTVVDRLQRFEESSGQRAVEHTVDLAKERYDLFVPKHRPEAGYGLIVFVSPGPNFPLSPDWKSELGARGFVFVSALRAGNQQNVYERRLPLALHGYHNVRARLPIDPERVYVAGFSGGSRTAQRLALSYADVFRGVILFGSSDPFGVEGITGEPPLGPPLTEFMDLFRRRTRVVFSTGSSDLPNQVRDKRTRASFAHHCVGDVVAISYRGTHHWVPEGRGLTKTLDAIDARAPQREDPTVCLVTLQGEIDAGLDHVDALLAAGQAAEAGKTLGELEDRYGGLAAPRSVALARRISAAL